jgi:hypothetical protein
MPTASMQHNANTEDSAPICVATGAAPSLAWEWRSFDYQPQLWRAALLRGVRTGPGSMTAETYLLAGRSPDSVKLRSDRVEVKQPLHTDSAGLQRWNPVVSAMFPLTRGTMDMLFHAWRRPGVDVLPPLITPTDLVSYLYSHAPDVRVIPLRKWRRAFRVRGCAVERTTVLVGGAVLESFSIAHEDAATLEYVVRSLHLPLERNTSYVAELKRLVGLAA